MNHQSSEIADESRNPQKKAKREHENTELGEAQFILNLEEIARIVCLHGFGQHALYGREAYDLYKVASLISKTFNKASKFSFRKVRLDVPFYPLGVSSGVFESFLEGFLNVTKIECLWRVPRPFASMGVESARMRDGKKVMKPTFKVLERVTSLNICENWYSRLLDAGVLPNLRSLRMRRLAVRRVDLSSYPNITKLSFIRVSVKTEIKLPPSLKSLKIIGGPWKSAEDPNDSRDSWLRFTRDASDVEEMILSRTVCRTIVKKSSPFSPISFPDLKKLTIIEEDEAENGPGCSRATVTLTRCQSADARNAVRFVVSVPVTLPVPLSEYFKEGHFENAWKNENIILPSQEYAVHLSTSKDWEMSPCEKRTSGTFSKTWSIRSEKSLLQFSEVAFTIRDYFTTSSFDWTNWENVMQLLAWGEGIGDFPYVNGIRTWSNKRTWSDKCIRRFFEDHELVEVAI